MQHYAIFNRTSTRCSLATATAKGMLFTPFDSTSDLVRYITAYGIDIPVRNCFADYAAFRRALCAGNA